MRLALLLRPGDGGSALALVPAAFLVLIVLGAIAVDSAAAYLGHRQLGDALNAATQDAAASGLSDQTFYRSGVVTIDPGTAQNIACRALTAQLAGELDNVTASIAVDGDLVGLRATARVREVFGVALPGVHWHTVSAVAVADAQQAPIRGTPINPSQYHPLECSPLR